jgi:hypothetical protein
MEELGIKAKLTGAEWCKKPYKLEHAGESDLENEEEKKSGSSE